MIEIVIWFAIILASVLLVMAVRRIAVQYARRTASGSYEKIMGSRQYIPLKLNASGVMPIIFAQAIMFVPGLIGGLDILKDSTVGQWLVANFGGNSMFGLWYNIVFGILIIVFTYFYTAITVPTNKMADDLKEVEVLYQGFDLALKLRSISTNYVSNHITRIYIWLYSCFSSNNYANNGYTSRLGSVFQWTSLLIMVGVAIDTMQQINSYLLTSIDGNENR